VRVLSLTDFPQVPGLDFADTFSPVAQFETVRILLAAAALEDWDIEALDVKTAFLYGALDAELYMEQPQGFMRQGQKARFIASESIIRIKTRHHLLGIKLPIQSY